MAGNLTERLRDSAWELALHAREQLNTAPLSPATVHDCRVAVKQLRAHWQLLRPWLNRNLHRQIDSALRDSAKALACARDEHVLQATLDTLARKASKHERHALLQIRQCLLDQGNRVPAEQDQLLADQAFRNDLTHWQSLSLNLSDHELLNSGLARTYKQCRNRARKAADSPDPHAWHDLRKWVKYLLYQQQSLGLNLAPVVDLRALGKRLGKLHDLHMLQDRLADRTGNGISPDDRTTALKVIRRREAALQRKCQSSSLALFARPSRKWIRQADN